MVTRSAACAICSSRKVRCDREAPACGNCVRRQQVCVYAEDQANARIKHLEQLVRSLGGDPEGEETVITLQRIKESPDSQEVGHLPSRSDAVLVQEENETLYLETPMWRAWNGKYYGPLNYRSKEMPSDYVLPTDKETSVFKSIFTQPDFSFRISHPNAQQSTFLWQKYFERVHPVTKTFFEQEIVDIRSKCTSGLATNLTDPEHAFVHALYLNTVLSLTDADCSILEYEKGELLARHNYCCEQALTAYNFWTVYDMLTIRTLIPYLYSNFAQDKLAGLWDGVGLLLRKAERMGLHRDGTNLKLSPWETERRRRVWWCIQGLDLASNSVSGATSMSQMADFDTKIPLNIEDTDITPEMKVAPPEREGLTSVSYVRWRYWVLEEQRKIRTPDGRRIGLTWTIEKLLPLAQRHAIIDKIEKESNEKFLRYSDPIKPLDMLTLIVSRAVVNFMRRTALCPGPSFKPAREFTKEDQLALLATSCAQIEYHVAAFNDTRLQTFLWHCKFLFPWSSFVHVLVELKHEKVYAEADRLWKLVVVLYETLPELEVMHDDRRKIYAAGLTLEGWNHIQKLRRKVGLPIEPQPDFVVNLQDTLSTISFMEAQGHKRKRNDEVVDTGRSAGPSMEIPEPWAGDLDTLPEIPMNFEDIDWMFGFPTGGEDIFPGFEAGGLYEQ